MSQMQNASNLILEDAQLEYSYQINKRYQEFMERVINDAKALRSDLYDELGIQPTYSDWVKFQGDYKMTRILQKERDALTDDVNNMILNNLKTMYKDSYNLNSWTMDETTPPSLDIEYRLSPDHVLDQFVNETWGDGVFSGLNASMAYDIQKNVMISMVQGDSTRELAGRIQRVIGDDGSGITYQAKRIARTELLRSANLARDAVFQDNSDLIQDTIWVSRALASGRLCDECALRSGHTLTEIEENVDGEFDLEDYEVEPPAHPNCGCTLIPKLKSWKDLLPKNLSKGMEEWDSYTMAIPSNVTGFMKVEPMSFGKWADTYLDDSERGNL